MRSEDQERAASRWPAASSSVPAPAALMSPGRPVWGRGRGGAGEGAQDMYLELDI